MSAGSVRTQSPVRRASAAAAVVFAVLVAGLVWATLSTVVTQPATSITATSALLVGSVNPGGEATTAWFRISSTDPGSCDDTFGVREPSVGGTDVGAGSSSVGYFSPATGLVAGTTYYFCAIASNPSGLSVGSVQTFATLAVPSMTTEPATGVTTTSVTLNGTGNPNGRSTTAWFRYSTTDPGTCSDTFGTSTSTTSLGIGSSPVSYSRFPSNLTVGATYYYCAIGSSSAGLGFGNVLTVKTLSTAPLVYNQSATSITGTTATLNALSIPNGDEATGYFRYSNWNPGTCTDAFGTRAPASGGTALGSGTGSVAFSEAITGLTPGTSYYFCAAASNSIGTTFGAPTWLRTPNIPTVTTSPVTGLTDTTATLRGTFDNEGAATTAWFRYSTIDPGTCDDAFGTRAPAAGDLTSSTFSEPLTGLAPATTYYYCAIASNLVGTGFGSVLSFTTQALPSVTTFVATNVTATSVTLTGSATPNGASTSGWFRYDTVDPGTCSDSFGTATSTGSSLGSGTSPVLYTRATTGLLSGVTYYYCAIASNSVGMAYGSVVSFTTPAADPVVTTDTVTSLTNTSATLRGSANPRGDAATGYFRFGTTNPGVCSDAFGTRVPAAAGTPLGAGNAVVPFTDPVSNLTPATTYYYCAAATNSVGTTFGSVRTFTTLDVPSVVTNGVLNQTFTSVTLYGAVYPNGATTTAWFRYSTTDPGTCDDTFGTRIPLTAIAVGGGYNGVLVYQNLFNLTPGTTCYYCAIASNSLGLGFGNMRTFQLGSAPLPTVTTQAATSVTSASATLNGYVDPNGTWTVGWFRYDTTDPGTCNDTFGARAPQSDIQLSDQVNVSYGAGLSFLDPAQTYYFCALASNLGGAAVGAIASFTTLPVPPFVVTSDATLELDGSVTLAGLVTPNGSSSTAWFQYDTVDPGTCSPAFGQVVPSAAISVGSGRAAVLASDSLSGLAPGRYYYCAAADNSAGTTYGDVKWFDVVDVGGVVDAGADADAGPSSGGAAASGGSSGTGTGGSGTGTGGFGPVIDASTDGTAGAPSSTGGDAGAGGASSWDGAVASGGTLAGSGGAGGTSAGSGGSGGPGSGGDGGSAVSNAGGPSDETGGAAGAPDAGDVVRMHSGDDGGCGCRFAPRATSWWPMLAIVLVVARRRHHRVQRAFR